MVNQLEKLDPNIVNLYGISHLDMTFKPTKGYGEWIFTVVSDMPIDVEKARLIQLQCNRHPSGYGFYGYSSYKKIGKDYITQWWCSNSCD